MAAKQWFLVKSSPEAKVVYLISADCTEAVEVVAGKIGRSPIIIPLTWQGLHELTGCVIPIGSNTMSFASGNFMLTKLRKPDIVLWPI